MAGLGLLITSLIITVGTFWAFDRGAPDFSVFYTAWQLVLEGRGADIYHASPDRFLYAPGFAWLLSPLALLPRSLALAFWCFGKAAVVGFVVREFQARRSFSSLGLATWGVVLVARPLLIDFQYGQVNVFILGACAWALLGHFRRSEAGKLDFVRWFVLAVAALAKVFPLPLLAVPWLLTAGISSRRLRLERAGMVVGLALMLLAPTLSQGLDGTWQLMIHWREALISRGLPLESHNQSFAAFLNHYFSGEPTHVVAEGMHSVQIGSAWLSARTITFLSLAWTAITGGFLLYWLLSGSKRAPLTWVAVMTGMLILPSHLVWKPYFVMALPLAILAINSAVSSEGVLRYRRGAVLACVFVAINLTGFDVMGHRWGALFESAALMLWAELVLIGMVVTPHSSFRKFFHSAG